MMYKHMAQYGDGVPSAVKGEGSEYDMVDSFGPLWCVADKLLHKLKPQILVYFSVNYIFKMLLYLLNVIISGSMSMVRHSL